MLSCCSWHHLQRRHPVQSSNHICGLATAQHEHAVSGLNISSPTSFTMRCKRIEGHSNATINSAFRHQLGYSDASRLHQWNSDSRELHPRVLQETLLAFLQQHGNVLTPWPAMSLDLNPRRTARRTEWHLATLDCWLHPFNKKPLHSCNQRWRCAYPLLDFDFILCYIMVFNFF